MTEPRRHPVRVLETRELVDTMIIPRLGDRTLARQRIVRHQRAQIAGLIAAVVIAAAAATLLVIP